MKYLLYLVVSVLIVAAVTQCGGPRTQAQQIRAARTKRLDEAEGL